MVLMDIKGDSVVINEQFNSTEDTTISGFGIFVQDDVLDFKYTINAIAGGSTNCTSTATKM